MENLRRNDIRIAKEGRALIIGGITLFIFVAALYFFTDFDWLKYLVWSLFVIVVFCINFFRDPLRNLPTNQNAVVSPADGKVVRILPVNDTEVGENAVLVSIFLNVFNVHVNRVPFDSTVISREYRPGKFLAAFDHKASDENEQMEILLDTGHGKMKVKQIAGLIARRIHCYADQGLSMKRGDRLGFIMFGSRTDIILPPGFKVLLEVGQIVKGGETILAEYR